ncbi:MAG: UDP-2,3-diacylglucosamine diphosphatase [Gammaproteobacteria bacterium]|nr:UDP-2,3-diacylglucosamine diphosphatase [Gammaproteobacteria bacterium]
MIKTLLIADLHLSGKRSATVELFLRFLKDEASSSQRLYILGDMFDVWIGDDDRTEPIPQIFKGLSDLAAKGTELFLLKGNRDFLIGEGFCRETGCSLLHDPAVVNLASGPTLLMHGDLLTTDDINYQRDREYLRSDEFRDNFLSKSLNERTTIATDMRQQSRDAKANLANNIMDVNQQAVEQYMRQNGTWQLIHGHTHLPATHDFRLDGRPARRIVLADWKEDVGPYLIDHGDGLESCIFR